MISEETQQAAGEVYRHALHHLVGVEADDAWHMPLPVLHGVYGRLLLAPLRSAFYWGAILSRPDLFEAGIAASTPIHEAQVIYRASLAELMPETSTWPQTFSWAFSLPVTNIGLKTGYTSLLGNFATVYAPHAGLEPYYKTGWRAQLLLELICYEQAGVQRLKLPEVKERYDKLLDLLQQPEFAAAVRSWIDLQVGLLQQVSHMASFPQVTAVHAVTALKQSRGYRPRELWRLNEFVMER